MKKNRWQPYVGFIVLSEAVGLLAGALTRNAMPAYDALLKPSLTPPDLAFPIAWGVLYLLMGIGAARIYQTDAPGRKKAIAVFGVQLAVNFAWSLIFFNLQAFGFSFFLVAAPACPHPLDDRAVLEAGPPGGAAANSLSALGELCGVFKLCHLAFKWLKEAPNVRRRKQALFWGLFLCGFFCDRKNDCAKFVDNFGKFWR